MRNQKELNKRIKKVKNPKEWIEKYWKKVNTIIFHFESLKNSSEINNLIKLIKSKNRKAGIAVKSETSMNKTKPFLKK